MKQQDYLQMQVILCYFTGNSYGFPVKQKLTLLERCAARGYEIAALQPARALRILLAGFFFMLKESSPNVPLT